MKRDVPFLGLLGVYQRVIRISFGDIMIIIIVIIVIIVTIVIITII